METFHVKFVEITQLSGRSAHVVIRRVKQTDKVVGSPDHHPTRNRLGPHPSWKKKLRIQFSGQPSRELSLVLHINRRLSTGRRNVFRRSLMTILTIYADLTPGQELRGVQADDAGGSSGARV